MHLLFGVLKSKWVCYTTTISSSYNTPRAWDVFAFAVAASDAVESRSVVASRSRGLGFRALPDPSLDADARGDVAPREDTRIDGAEPRTFAYEPRSKSKRRRGKTTRRATVEVDSPAVDALLGKREKTMGQETEEAYVTFLFAYVCVIFVLGVVLGVSAFGKMPEAVDGFVSERLYPFFTPFVGGFLAFSSAYGVIKTRDDPNGG